MPVKTDAIGKSYEPRTYAVGREKIREYAYAVGESNPVHLDPEAARAAGYADVVAPPMFAVVYSAPVHGAGDLRPRGRHRLRADGPRRAGVRAGSARSVAGDEITTTATVKDISERGGMGFYVFETVSTNQDGETVCTGHLDQHRAGGLTMAALEAGTTVAELKVTPDKYLTVRYAGASGDFNPIHIDEEFAKAVGLPGQDPARPVDDGAGGAGDDRRGRRPASRCGACRSSSAAWACPSRRSS